MDFVFDTYAIIEIIKGNKNYLPYLDNRVIINNFIFAEICYVFIRDNYLNAGKYLGRYEKFIVNLTPKLIKEAMKFRYKNKGKNLSVPDCVSYFQARELGIKFLTGDNQFENLEGVEFIK